MATPNPVLDKLTDRDPERERQCLADSREGCGLTPFLAELRERVVTGVI